MSDAAAKVLAEARGRRFDWIAFLTRYGTLVALALLLLFNILFNPILVLDEVDEK